MRRKNIILGLTLAGVALSLAETRAISLDFSSLIGASIKFDGTADNFQFLNSNVGSASGNSFRISLSDGSGDSVGLAGRINGAFTIGTIVTSGLEQTASVTSSAGAQLIINDGATPFAGYIDWITITTIGSGGDLNLTGFVNLTGITYAGSKSDLLALKGDSSSASATVAFSFNPAKSLTDLTTDGVINKTSFTGDLTSVPEGGPTLVLLGSALLGIGMMVRPQPNGSWNLKS